MTKVSSILICALCFLTITSAVYYIRYLQKAENTVSQVSSRQLKDVPSPVQAKSADDFVDAIGVGVGGPFSYSSTSPDYVNVLKPNLLDMGVRYVRYVIPSAIPHPNIGMLTDLGNSGIKSLVTTKLQHTLDSEGDSTTFNASTTAAVVKAIGVSNVLGVEGPNEYSIGNTDPNWHQHLFDYTELVYNNLKADSETANVTIVGPTIDPDNSLAVVATQDFSSLVNFGNSHTYERPYTSNSNYYQQHFYDYHSARYPGRLMWITETGANTSTSSTTGFAMPVTLTGQSQNITRNLLRFYQRGARKVFIYQFQDTGVDSSDPQQRFGMLNFDGTKKPSFDAVKNLITILEEPGQTNYSADTLSFALTGAPSTGKSLLLQKSNGDFYLALWNEVDGESSQPVTVQLSFGESVGNVSSYSPLTNTTATPITASSGSYPVSMGASPTIIKIEKYVATPAPASSATPTNSSTPATTANNSSTTAPASSSGSTSGSAAKPSTTGSSTSNAGGSNASSTPSSSETATSDTSTGEMSTTSPSDEATPPATDSTSPSEAQPAANGEAVSPQDLAKGEGESAYLVIAGACFSLTLLLLGLCKTGKVVFT